MQTRTLVLFGVLFTLGGALGLREESQLRRTEEARVVLTQRVDALTQQSADLTKRLTALESWKTDTVDPWAKGLDARLGDYDHVREDAIAGIHGWAFVESLRRGDTVPATPAHKPGGGR